MELKGNDLAPYFKNGRLHLPEQVIPLLAKAGLSQEIIDAARTGLAMDDHSIAKVSAAMENLLAHIVSTDVAQTK